MCSSDLYDEALGFTENPAAYNAVDLSELRATRTREINVRMPDSAIITRVPPNTTQDELRYKFKEHLLWKPLSILRVSLAPIFQSTVLFFLFFPPFMLLALGYIGLWVGRGFRKW